ncbi:MAG TPA: DNA polymerase III subunit delta [Novosphingobium sp.]|nr:DNA polymerase III subunit delta [Novosphingobium sp.]
MKLTQGSFAASAGRAARECRIFYFCGPDEAGAHDAAQAIVALLPAGSERVELSGGELRRDSVRLADEARSTSLFGGTPYIHVRTAGDEAFEAVEILLESPVETCPVLISASSASDKSRIAKLLGDRPQAMVAMFYPPELGAVTQAVRGLADAAGVRLDTAMAERIAKSCALDTRMARSEIDKLALYLDASPQAPRSADAEALDAIAAKCDDDSFAGVVNCVLGGDLGRLSGELARMRELSLNPVGLVLAFERRAAQLAQLAARIGRRSDVAGFMEAEKKARRVFFRDAPDLANQLRRWRGRRLERLVERLVGLHRELLANSQHAELLLAQGLTDIARAAAAGNARA